MSLMNHFFTQIRNTISGSQSILRLKLPGLNASGSTIKKLPSPVPSGSPTVPAAGRSSSGGRRSGSGQAAQLREGSQRASGRRHPARARPAATMPKRKVSSAEGARGRRRRRSPRGGRRGCQLNLLL